MKKAVTITIVLMLVLVTVSGCYEANSLKGGSVLVGEDFKIAVPYFDTKVKQGEVKSVTVSLKRGEYFKQDVKLQIKAPAGITIDPTYALVKASDKPDVQLRISAAKDSALGGYLVSVTGTPTTGEPASTEFNVRVVTP